MSLDNLWAGWRHEYVASATEAERIGDAEGCVFCRLAHSGEPDAGNGIVWRGPLAFAVLNAYPYSSGHLLVLPVRHVADLVDLAAHERSALWATAEAGIAALTTAYRPDGLNLGANLGRAAGAGIPRHLHLHVLPRWSGDTNFMTAVAGVRVMPEPLPTSWRRLHDAWPAT